MGTEITSEDYKESAISKSASTIVPEIYTLYDSGYRHTNCAHERMTKLKAGQVISDRRKIKHLR